MEMEESTAILRDGNSGRYNAPRDSMHDIRQLADSLSSGAASPGGSIYFIDATNGLDTNDGLSPDTPLKTVGKFVGGAAPLAVDGDAAICYGTFTEHVVVDKRVRMVAVPGTILQDLTAIGPVGPGVLFDTGSAGSELNGFLLNSGNINRPVIDIEDTRIWIHKCEFNQPSADYITMGTTNNCLIEDNVMLSCIDDSIRMDVTTLTDNIIRDNVIVSTDVATLSAVHLNGQRNHVYGNVMWALGGQIVLAYTAGADQNVVHDNFIRGALSTDAATPRTNSLYGNVSSKMTGGGYVESVTVTVANDVAEQELNSGNQSEFGYNGRVTMDIDVATLVTASEGGTTVWRLYVYVDATTRRLVDRKTFIVGTDSVFPSLSAYISGASNTTIGTWETTYQMGTAVTANRAIPFKITTEEVLQ